MDLTTNTDQNQSPSLEQKRSLSEVRDSAVLQHTELLLLVTQQMSMGREEGLFPRCGIEPEVESNATLIVEADH